MMSPKTTTYKTKTGLGLILFITVVLGGILVLSIYKGHYTALFIVLPLAAFIFYFIFAITYVVKEGNLFIRCRGLYNISIPVSSIHKIEETWSMLSSPASSTDRLEIIYNTYDSVMISPKDKSGFINALKEVNPAIEVILKNKT